MGNREETTKRLVEAALAILSEQGFAAIGVNAVARRAGTDKQLIYRYFNGLDGLMAAAGEAVAAGLSQALERGLQPPPADYGDLAARVAGALLDHARSDAMFRALRLMEAAAPSDATAAFRRARGAAMMQWVAEARKGLTPPPGLDAPALNAVLVAAAEGAALLGTAGIGDSPEDRARIDAALEHIARAAFAAAPG